MISSKDTGEERVMLSKSDNIEIMINDKVDEVIEKLFSITSFQILNWVGNINEGSDFVFDCVHLFYYKCHKINPNRVRSYIDWHTGIPGLWTQELDAGLWMLDTGHWALDTGLWTMDSGHWTLSFTVSEQNQNPVSDST